MSMGFTRLIGAFICGIALLLVSCVEEPKPTPPKPAAQKDQSKKPTEFKKEGELYCLSAEGDTLRKLDIEIAAIEEERTRGLMWRRNMPDTQGMLFIFEREEQRSFWMKNTLIGLDILFIKENGEVESISKYTIPKSERSIPSKGPAKYVLEVTEGFCDLYSFDVGDRIVWSGEDQRP